MPTYEYKCPKCGRFEIEQRITEDALGSCPTCSSEVKRLMPRRLIIQFKGPGFHVNDYSSTGYKKSDSPPPAEAEATKTEKPDGKAADKAESKSAAGES